MFSCSAGATAAQAATATSPTLAAQQWLGIWKRGHYTGTPLVLISAGCFAWLKYRTSHNIYLAAAASCLAVTPFTVCLLARHEGFLSAAALVNVTGDKEKESIRAGEIREALGSWGFCNMVRAVFPFVAGVVGLTSICT